MVYINPEQRHSGFPDSSNAAVETKLCFGIFLTSVTWALPHSFSHVMRLRLGGGRVLSGGVSFINTFSLKVHIKVITEEFRVIDFAPPLPHGPG